MSQDALVKQQPGALARPSYIPVGGEGTDHIEKEDILLPRVAIAQPLSPQMQDDAVRIEGLKVGHFFNTVSGENYGDKIQFTVIRGERPRGVEFHPMEEGGGVKDPDVPLDDPRMQFGPDGEKPVATKFYDYLIMLLPTREVAVLSLKGTGIKCAKQLNSLMKLRNTPACAGLYDLSTITKKDGARVWAVPNVRNAGFVTEEEFNHGLKVYASFSGKAVKTDQDNVPDAAEGDPNVPF